MTSRWPPEPRRLWRLRCLSHYPGPGTHWPIRRPVPGGGTEVRCTFCDRTIPELEGLHP